MRLYKYSSKNSGFTLIELIVVIGILTLILASLMTILNPVQQINKAKVAQKISDLEQMKTALDLYYDDNHCYPNNIPNVGSPWQVGGTVYMQKIPQSTDNSAPYIYETDGICPQWYSIFARVDVNTSKISNRCPLANNNCMPPDDSNNHICTYGGTVDCSYVTSVPLGD
jgi:prepilin-type N-terminal cleavage/methylation domain-containing protein